MRTRRAVILGAGGHAKVVIDGCRAMGGVEVIGCLSQDSIGTVVNGAPVIGGDDRIEALLTDGITNFVLAIGSNQLRLRLYDLLIARDATPVVVIHPAATIAPTARIGPGTVVMPGAVVNADAVIGVACIVNTLAGVDHDCIVGDAVHLAPNSALAGCVRVGRRTLVGVGATIIPGISIGEDCVLGAGACVIADVADGQRLVGVPAR